MSNTVGVNAVGSGTRQASLYFANQSLRQYVVNELMPRYEFDFYSKKLYFHLIFNSKIKKHHILMILMKVPPVVIVGLRPEQVAVVRCLLLIFIIK